MSSRLASGDSGGSSAAAAATAAASVSPSRLSSPIVRRQRRSTALTSPAARGVPQARTVSTAEWTEACGGAAVNSSSYRPCRVASTNSAVESRAGLDWTGLDWTGLDWTSPFAGSFELASRALGGGGGAAAAAAAAAFAFAFAFAFSVSCRPPCSPPPPPAGRPRAAR